MFPHVKDYSKKSVKFNVKMKYTCVDYNIGFIIAPFLLDKKIINE